MSIYKEIRVITEVLLPCNVKGCEFEPLKISLKGEKPVASLRQK
jgi:hypothetical protein